MNPPSLPPSPSFLISLGSPWHSHLRCSLPETWGIGWGDGGSPRASNSGISSRSNGVSAPPDSPSRGYKARFFFFFFFLNLSNQLVYRRRQYFDGNKKKMAATRVNRKLGRRRYFSRRKEIVENEEGKSRLKLEIKKRRVNEIKASSVGWKFIERMSEDGF